MNEIQFSFLTSRTAYFLARNRVGQIWNTSGGTGAFENYLSANYLVYALSCTEQGSSAYFAGTFPAAVVPGVYSITAKQQIGGSVAESDPTIAVGDYQWNGAFTLPLSDLATSGQFGQGFPISIYRGQMVKNFPFKLVSSADHITPFTSGIISGQIARDGGSFGALQSGAFAEMGKGWYALQALTSGDLLANVAALTFTAVGVSGGSSDQRDFSFILQRTSGV